MSDVNPIDRSPTVVLVHGAFAEGSSWSGMIEQLQATGIRAIAPANPLRGLASDVCLSGVLEQTPGPVLDVGSSAGFAQAILDVGGRTR